MGLLLETYIHKAYSSFPPLQFAWDDANTEIAENPLDQHLLGQLRTLPHTVLGPLTCALSEWVILRLKHYANTDLAEQWVEASWQGIEDITRVARMWEEVRSLPDWQGQVLGPIDLAMRYVQWSLEDLQGDGDGDLALSCARLQALTIHMLQPHVEGYKKWLNAILSKFMEIQGVPDLQTVKEILCLGMHNTENGQNNANVFLHA